MILLDDSLEYDKQMPDWFVCDVCPRIKFILLCPKFRPNSEALLIHLNAAHYSSVSIYFHFMQLCARLYSSYS